MDIGAAFWYRVLGQETPCDARVGDEVLGTRLQGAGADAGPRAWAGRGEREPDAAGRARDNIVSPTLHQFRALSERVFTPVGSSRPIARAMGKSGLSNFRHPREQLARSTNGRSRETRE